MRFAVPLDRVLSVRVFGLADPVLGDFTRVGQGGFGHALADLEQAVQRRIQFTGHVAHDVGHGQQVFAETRLVDHATLDRDQLRQGHHGAVGCTQGQSQEFVQTHLRFARQLQAHRHGELGVAIVQVRRVGAAECRVDGLRDHLGGDAQALRALALDAQEGTRRVFLHGRVHAHDVGGVREGLGHVGGQGAAAFFVRTIDLGHDGREHGRARRHFHHLDARTVDQSDALQLGSVALGNGVAFLAAVGGVGQVDLQIATLGVAAQVVLAHQTVEGDGAGRARVTLHVRDFGLLGQPSAHVLQRGGGAFEWRACRHVQHHLVFALVVKGQHLEHHTDPARGHQGQGHRHHQSPQDAVEQLPAFARARQQGREGFGEGVLQNLGDLARRGVGVAVVFGQLQGQPRRDGEGDDQGQGHAHAGVDRDGAHVRAHQARHKGHGQERGDHREGGQDGGATDLVHCARDDHAQWHVRRELSVPVDVLHHHDGVVHQDTDRENQGEQRHTVEREAPSPTRKQGGGERQHHGCAHDHGFAATQGQTHQNDHAAGGKNQFLDQLVGFVGGSLAIVARDLDLHVAGDDRVFEQIQTLHRTRGHIDRVFARFFGHRHRHGGVALALNVGAQTTGRAGREPNVTQRLLRARFDTRHFAQVNGAALVDADDDVAHVLCVLQKLAGLHAQHAGLTLGRCGVDHRARRHGLVGRSNGLVQLLHAHAALAQAARLDPHMHRLAGAADGFDFARAWHALELSLDRVRHAFEFLCAAGVGAPESGGQHRHVVDAFGLDDRRHCTQTAGQPVLVGVEHVVHAHQGFGARHAHLELHGQHRHART